MAADVLRLNIFSFINFGASYRLLCLKSATSPIPEPLAVMADDTRHFRLSQKRNDNFLQT